MGLQEDLAAEMAEFTSDSDLFGISITLKSPDNQTATISGRHNKHHQLIDPNSGMLVDGKNATVTISELKLKELFPNYPIRNADAASEVYQEVDMVGHLVSVKDSTGVVKNYKVFNHKPDESLGLIVLILSDYRE